MNVYGNVRNYDSNLDIYSNVYEYDIDEVVGAGLVCYITLNLNIQIALTLIR